MKAIKKEKSTGVPKFIEWCAYAAKKLQWVDGPATYKAFLYWSARDWKKTPYGKKTDWRRLCALSAACARRSTSQAGRKPSRSKKEKNHVLGVIKVDFPELEFKILLHAVNDLQKRIIKLEALRGTRPVSKKQGRAMQIIAKHGKDYTDAPIWVCAADGIFDLRDVSIMQPLDSGKVVISSKYAVRFLLTPIRALRQSVGHREFHARHMGIGIRQVSRCPAAKNTAENAYLSPSAFLILDCEGNVKFCPADQFAALKSSQKNIAGGIPQNGINLRSKSGNFFLGTYGPFNNTAQNG